MINPWIIFAVSTVILVLQIVEIWPEYRCYHYPKRATKPLTLLATGVIAAVALWNGYANYQRGLPRRLHHIESDARALSGYPISVVKINCVGQSLETALFDGDVVRMLNMAGWGGRNDACGNIATGVRHDVEIVYGPMFEPAARALGDVLRSEGQDVAVSAEPVSNGAPSPDSTPPTLNIMEITVTISDRR